MPELGEIFTLFFTWMNDIFLAIDSVKFYIYSFELSLGWLLVGFVIVSIVASVFWKGAKG